MIISANEANKRAKETREKQFYDYTSAILAELEAVIAERSEEGHTSTRYSCYKPAFDKKAIIDNVIKVLTDLGYQVEEKSNIEQIILWVSWDDIEEEGEVTE